MKFKYFFVCCLLSFFASVRSFAEISLTNSAPCDRNPNTKTVEQLNAGGIVLDVLATTNAGQIYTCSGWTNLGVGDKWYLAKETIIHAVNATTKQYLGSWPLTEAEEITEPEPDYVERRREFEVPMTYDRMVDDPTLGCMGNNPLKYGDIEGDGKKELVVFIKNTLQIFSVEHKKVVFSVQLDVDDWHTKEYSKEIISELRGTSESLPDDPQYQSRTYYDAGGASGTLAALRGYAKLYVGSYSGENAKDIVIWRKVYKSNLLKDPVAGFTKLSDAYIHYKLIDGEYKKQFTEQEVIKDWLADKNLTWQKGYPSKSECPGQEDQLIPEMHDPLLNDPDVLK